MIDSQRPVFVIDSQRPVFVIDSQRPVFVIDILASFLLKKKFSFYIVVDVKMAEGSLADDHEEVKYFAALVFRQLINAGGEEVAVDFLEKVFFEPVSKAVFNGFCRDAEFLKWEREFFQERQRDSSSPILKATNGFAEIVEQSVRLFLFEKLVDEVLTKMKEVVFARIMVDRWLFAGKSVEGRVRALKAHKRQALRRALRKCQHLEGFTGICLFV